MEFSGLLSGAAPTIKSYQINESVTRVGIPLLIGAADEAGLDLPTTTAVNDMVGLNYDTATYVTAQQTDGSSPERTVKVAINPDIIVKALLSGGATEGTALTQYDVTTASATGLVVTTGDDWTSPQFDEGAIWGYTGANAGQIRKITSTSVTAATVTVAFQNDTVIGDNFLRANFWPMDASTVQLTTNFTQVDASAAVAVNTAEFMPIEIIANDASAEGTTNSYVLMVCRDHILNQGDG